MVAKLTKVNEKLIYSANFVIFLPNIIASDPR